MLASHVLQTPGHIDNQFFFVFAKRFLHPPLTLVAGSECLGDIFMSSVCTAPVTVRSCFINRLLGTVTRLMGIIMRSRIG